MDKYRRAIECVTPELLHHIETYPDAKSHHAAVLFYRHKPVCWATNRPDRGTLDGAPVWSVHAEVEVLRKSCAVHRARGDELLVIRRRKDGSLANSMCCPACMAFIANHTAVRKIVFTTTVGELTVHRVRR